MSERRRVVLVGATGLVGRQVLALANRAPALALTALARREIALPRGWPLEMVVAPTLSWPELIGRLAPEVLICALGSTRARSGRAGLEAVDRELVVGLAGAARAAGTRHMVHVSSVAANPASRFAYLRIKGEAEQQLRLMGFSRLDLLRPGLLLGARTHDLRPFELVGQALHPLLDPLIHESCARFRSIPAHEVAACALVLAQSEGEGVFVHEHASLKQHAALLA